MCTHPETSNPERGAGGWVGPVALVAARAAGEHAHTHGVSHHHEGARMHGPHRRLLVGVFGAVGIMHSNKMKRAD